MGCKEPGSKNKNPRCKHPRLPKTRTHLTGPQSSRTQIPLTLWHPWFYVFYTELAITSHQKLTSLGTGQRLRHNGCWEIHGIPYRPLSRFDTGRNANISGRQEDRILMQVWQWWGKQEWATGLSKEMTHDFTFSIPFEYFWIPADGEPWRGRGKANVG